MKEIELTQNQVALVDDEDYEYLMQFNWLANRRGRIWYALGYPTKSGGKQKLFLMHRIIMNTVDGVQTDHINGNGLDNRKSNLRICTAAQNQWNRHATGDGNKTGYKGVGYTTRNYKGKTYRSICARIKFRGKRIYLGVYKTETEAAKAYNEAAIKYFGEFARLNEICYQDIHKATN